MSRKKKDPEELSVDELRRLLLEKRRLARKERLAHFRRTGRAVLLDPDIQPQAAEEFMSTKPEAEPASGQAAAEPPAPRRGWGDRILTGIEILAVLGLFFVIYSVFNILSDLNAEMRQSHILPTITPTPLITAIVLPSGHTPPDANGISRPNNDEIPEHLRPAVQTLASLPLPTPSPAQAIRIQIPAIGVDAPIVQGDGWEQLKKGVGQYIGSANPGEKGNLVLSAHNDIFGEIFRDLDQLKPGDEIIIYTSMRQYVYVVTSTEIVEPLRVDVMRSQNQPTLTLISCYPYLVDNKRIVVFAKLQNQ